jgi:hypothetical protein
MRLRILVGATMMFASLAATAVGLAGNAGIASADPVHVPLCGSTEATVGTALSGNYHNLRITGIAYVAKNTTVNVSGDLTLAPGSCLDAFSLGSVHVGQDVAVEKGATLGLGCAPGANGPPGIAPCHYAIANDTVGGNIVADEPLTMYLTAVTVHGNVASYGGGFSTPGLSFPVKNMSIAGNLVLQGWHGGKGAWIGALRNHIGGYMLMSNNVGHRPGEDGSNDSTEVDGNTIANHLTCRNNTPPAQYGDAYNPQEGNGPNVVGHKAVGECAGLTVPPPTS